VRSKDAPLAPHEGPEPFIFVSYASKDKDIVKPILEQLHGQGYRLWWDEGIRGGDAWWRKILERLTASCFMLLFVTPNANESEWVADEVFEVRNRRKKIFPVYLEPVPNLTLPITRYHFIERWACASEDDFLGKLYASLPKETKQTEPKPSVPPIPTEYRPEVGKLYSFGPYEWQVLDVQGNRALLLSKDIIEKRRAYDDKRETTTWEECALREYLNGAFFDSFKEDRKRIALTHNENPANTWGRTDSIPYNTPGGNPTDDYIFLLSVAEVLKYFPGLTLTKKSIGDGWPEWEDRYKADERLIAKFNNKDFWWWLRSPGSGLYCAVRILEDGEVFLCGTVIDNDGGVRPALWLAL